MAFSILSLTWPVAIANFESPYPEPLLMLITPKNILIFKYFSVFCMIFLQPEYYWIDVKCKVLKVYSFNFLYID